MIGLYFRVFVRVFPVVLAVLLAVFLVLGAVGAVGVVLAGSPLHGFHYQRIGALPDGTMVPGPGPGSGPGSGGAVPSLHGAQCAKYDHVAQSRGITYLCVGDRVLVWDGYAETWRADAIQVDAGGVVVDVVVTPETGNGGPSYFFYITWRRVDGTLELVRFNRGSGSTGHIDFTRMLPETRLTIMTWGPGDPLVSYTPGSPADVPGRLEVTGGSGDLLMVYLAGRVWRIDPTADGYPGDHGRNYRVPFDNPSNGETFYSGLSRPRPVRGYILDGLRIYQHRAGGGDLSTSLPWLDLATVEGGTGRTGCIPGGPGGAGGAGTWISGGFEDVYPQTGSVTYGRFVFHACKGWWSIHRFPESLSPPRTPAETLEEVNFPPLVGTWAVDWGWGGGVLLTAGEAYRVNVRPKDPVTARDRAQGVRAVSAGNLDSHLSGLFEVDFRADLCNGGPIDYPWGPQSPTRPALRLVVYREPEGAEREPQEIAAGLWEEAPAMTPHVTAVTSYAFPCSPAVPGVTVTASQCQSAAQNASNPVLKVGCQTQVKTPRVSFDPDVWSRYWVELRLSLDSMAVMDWDGEAGAELSYGLLGMIVTPGYEVRSEGFRPGNRGNGPIFKDGAESGSVDYWQ